jgi:SAM-dependent methyltransferase
MLAAELVGPTGSVVGVDVNPAILDTARRRAERAGHANVTFVPGDIRDVPLDDDFDAVVGRLILLYLRDPAAVLRQLLPHVRAGGVTAFTEYEFTVGGVANPPSRIHEQVHDWAMRAVAFSGADVAMGMKLHQVFVDAGFEAPQMIVDAMVGGSPQFIAEWTAFATDTVRSLLPLLVKGGIATEEEVGIDTLAARYREEVMRQGSMLRSYLIMGAWAHKG